MIVSDHASAFVNTFLQAFPATTLAQCFAHIKEVLVWSWQRHVQEETQRRGINSEIGSGGHRVAACLLIEGHILDNVDACGQCMETGPSHEGDAKGFFQNSHKT